MIYLKMQGRLGNQFFQYTFAKYVQSITHQALFINFDRVRKNSKSENDGWDNALKDFCASENGSYIEVSNKDIRFFSKLIKLKICRTLISNKQKRKEDGDEWGISKGVIYCYNPESKQFNIQKEKSYIIDGLFEYNYIVDAVLPLLKNDLESKYKGLENNSTLFEKIRNTNSICVSIRKFDLEDSKFTEYYQVCTLEYYYRAIEYIFKSVPDAKVFVFSDAVDWCKSNFKIREYLNRKDIDVFYESGQDPVWEKLRLMKTCKHFVLSNSTFSWWAQKLSSSENKIVCAPEFWHKDQETKSIGIYDEKWILIKN